MELKCKMYNSLSLDSIIFHKTRIALVLRLRYAKEILSAVILTLF